MTMPQIDRVHCGAPIDRRGRRARAPPTSISRWSWRSTSLRSVNEERCSSRCAATPRHSVTRSVTDAIAQTPSGAIAVTLVQWWPAGLSTGYRLDGYPRRRNGKPIANTIAETARALDGSTSLSGAIDFSARLLQTNGHSARRRVIDVSGDGSNNQGRPRRIARDEAVAAGIMINGLPILTEPALDTYYREHVIGGPGRSWSWLKTSRSFSDAILRKLTIEIAGADAPDQQVAMLPRHEAELD